MGTGRRGSTDASTFSSMAVRARAIASRDPARAISRSGSPCWNWLETLMRHPVEDCISLIVSPPSFFPHC